MRLDEYREVFDSGVHDIPNRLKEIDVDFFVVRNHRTRAWEVHHKGQLGNSLALNLPFDELDYRTVVYTKRNLIENAKERFAEIDRANTLWEQQKKKEIDNWMRDRLSEIHKYASRYEGRDAIPEKDIPNFLK